MAKPESNEIITLQAPVTLWRTIGKYARWIIEQAEDRSRTYCPRIGAQKAAARYLAVLKKMRAKRRSLMRMSLYDWSWLARGLYEAEQQAGEERPEFPLARASGQFLARMLDRQNAWPMWHGSTCVNLKEWGQFAYGLWEPLYDRYGTKAPTVTVKEQTL